VSKKAWLALCLVFILPLVGYFLLKYEGNEALHMPGRYFPDSVTNVVVNGKVKTDTAWHKVANITLTNQLGKQVSLDDLNGQIIIADFFFTHCPSICPTLTRNMKGLQDGLKMRDPRKRIDTSFVHFLSFSVDPVRDSVPVLKKYADKYNIDHDGWWLLTGNKDSIYNYAIDELKLGLQDGNGVDEAFIHTDLFVLIDKNRQVRGFYHGTDASSMSKLMEDLTLIMLEKDRTRKSPLFEEIKSLWPIFLIAIAAIFLTLFMMSRKKPKPL
jgi:protein SCO1